MSTQTAHRLLRPINRQQDHTRGGEGRQDTMSVVIYGDYLCPYCRRLRQVLEQLRRALGDRMVYVFRHFPNERVHPGSELASVASEAAAEQGHFWAMHDALFTCEPRLDRVALMRIAAKLGLDTARFERDLDRPQLRRRVQESLEEGRRTGVTATPTIFIDGILYDGAWDFHSMLEALERPVGAKVHRTARAFANLPASAGIALLIAAGAAIACANSSLHDAYSRLVDSRLAVGPPSAEIALTVAQWCSEGLLAVFYLILGLEIRREMTSGSLADWRAATAPLLAGVNGVIASALVYLAFNTGSTAVGWPTTADTGIAFTLAVLALFGTRVSASLKLFVTTYAVSNDLSSTLILAIFYPHGIALHWLAPAAGAIASMALFARWRIYAAWPYLVAALGLWLSLHGMGISGALSGLALAIALPQRPAPNAGPLLAQAATALAELENAEKELTVEPAQRRHLEQAPVWSWAARNLRAAADRLQSPAERVERTVEPWSTYVVLPVFAFTASGISLAVNLVKPDADLIFIGVILALAIGKPLGIVLTTWAAIQTKIARLPLESTPASFLGAACLCGIGDPFAFYMAGQAFANGAFASAAKLGVLVGSGLSAALGAIALAFSTRGTPAR